MLKQIFYILIFQFWTQVGNSLTCAQCNGVHGYYPNRDFVSTCDNRNNACGTANFCVKIVDPIIKSRHYTTFKSDCYYSNTISSTSNSSAIESGRCYPFNDGGNPPKQYLYCFCNNRDFCNGAPSIKSWPILILVAFIYYFYSK